VTLALVPPVPPRDPPPVTSSDDAWPEGTRVELDLAGALVRGRVLFLAEGWVYWTEDRTGRTHASWPVALRRVA
jgi:hypothetical protein